MPGGPAGAPRASRAAGGSGEARAAGLAHVAAVSFLAARAAPSGGFWITLAGGVALARASERFGARKGFGASLAAMLQSVAVMGPARLGVPLTQALSAPLLGRMDANGRSAPAQVVACALIRTAQNALGAAFFIGIVTGVDAYAASYDETVARLLPIPTGEAAALGATALGLLAWSAFASTVQVLVYRRGLERWRREELPGATVAPAATEPHCEVSGRRDDTPQAPAPPDAGGGARGEAAPAGARRPLDARAVAVAAAVAFTVLLTSTSPWLLAAVSAWLGGATLAARPLDREALPAGLVLATLLAASAFAFTMVGSLGLDLALRRAARAGLLVLVATWLRAAAGSEGLREVARRSLHRLRAVPSLAEAARDLDEIGATPRLAAAGRTLFRSLGSVRKRPRPLVDAVLRWVRAEAARFTPAEAPAGVRLETRARDAALVVLAAMTGVALFVPV